MSEKSLKGKIAWVTGSSRGIGLEIARHLAKCGANVVLHGSSEKSPQSFGEGTSITDLANEIAKTHGVETLVACGDLTKSAVVKELVKQIHARFGRIDILINNAGGDIGTAGVTAPKAGKPVNNDAIFIGEEDMITILNRNLLTCIYPCQAVAPEMIDRKQGKIVNIGSIAGLTGIPESAIYATAKAAVHEYTRCLAAMLRPHGVHANVIAPGDTLTERFKASRPLEKDRVENQTSLERYGFSSEIASAVEFLASDASSYVTGQVLRVDGGRQLWPS